MAKNIKGTYQETPIARSKIANLSMDRRFTVAWVCLHELSFDGIKSVPSHLGKGRRAIAVMDGQEICPESGYELLRAYSQEDQKSPCS
jgi:hypothetical protein